MNALERGRARGAVTVGLTGFDGGTLKHLCDHCITVPNHNMQHVEGDAAGGAARDRRGDQGYLHRVHLDRVLILLVSLVASGQIRLRRIDGWRKIVAVLSQHTPVAA